jgi:two-component system sensor histidine kinase SenX3
VSSPAVVVIAAAALLVGLLVGGWLADGSFRRPDEAEEPPPVEIAAILGALRATAILLDENLDVLELSPSAYAYRLVRPGGQVHPDLVRLAKAAQRSGQPQMADVALDRGRSDAHSVLAVRATELTGGALLLLCEDRTQASRADEARRDFVANISHELKTPIGAIGLLSEAIDDAADDPESVHRFAGRLQRESGRLAKLVNEIIDLSRLQFDNPVESARAVGVDGVIAEAIDRVRSVAEAKNIRLVRGGPHGLEVIGDKTQLVTAVNNLVDNAVAYSPEHTRVAVGVREREDAVEVTVSDQGIGIPEAELDRIFERFYRVDQARSRATGGTGLGLSIVKHIASAHGGDVSVWSSHGAGSTFTLRLPRHPVSTSIAESDRPADRAAADVTEGTA